MTDIQNFYKNKNIFLTGGSGFLGKVFIEKLLRVTNVGKIYFLIRAKKGKSIDERLKEIFCDPLFDTLHKLDQLAFERIIPISGDCAQPNLGLSSKDTSTLIENIQIVIHGAATVRFNEPLSTAVVINVQATLDLLNLAKKMKNLEAFVHVSSAFANCLDEHIEERYYVDKLDITAKQICAMAEILGSDTINGLSEQLCKKYPNTYCFTKALAEDAVLKSGNDLPISIFRPGIVVPTCEEPIAGWIDNLYGPTSILYGAVHGVLRVVYVDVKTNSCIIPVDFCANVMITCAWKTAKESLHQSLIAEPKIYNLVPDVRNIINWSEYKRAVEEYGAQMPLTRMIWFPFLLTTNSKLFYIILCFLYHTIPGYVYDFYLTIMGKKRRMVKLYSKIQKQTLMLEYFVKHNFTFSMENTECLWQSLSESDQRLFKFDVLSINWPQYFYNSLCGMRRYLGKEEPDTIPKGINLLRRLYLLHRTLQCLICGGGLTLLFWTFSKLFKHI